MRGRKESLKGKKFGRLTVLREAENLGRGSRWLCLCACGIKKTIALKHMTHGGVVSCGCYARERASAQRKATAVPFDDRLRRNDKTGCLEWTGLRNKFGYGRHYVNRQHVAAHRFAYARANGPIPKGLQVCHSCDNRACCEPSHLFVGDAFDNMGDANAKGRHAHGGRHGRSKLTEADIPRIRALLAAGLSQQAVADVFGVDQTQISRIKLGQLWGHVP